MQTDTLHDDRCLTTSDLPIQLSVDRAWLGCHTVHRLRRTEHSCEEKCVSVFTWGWQWAERAPPRQQTDRHTLRPRNEKAEGTHALAT